MSGDTLHRAALSLSPVLLLCGGSSCFCSVTPRSRACPENMRVYLAPRISAARAGLAKTHFPCKGSFLLPCRITSALRGAAQHLRTVGILWERVGIL